MRGDGQAVEGALCAYVIRLQVPYGLTPNVYISNVYI